MSRAVSDSKSTSELPKVKRNSSLEELSESISRSLAGRVSRRSFLGRLSQGAVVASLGTGGLALIRPEEASACAHNCTVNCVDLPGHNHNSCPSNFYATCACGAWCFSDGACESGVRRWEDCCGINYCSDAGGCQCVAGGYPTCCNTKVYNQGCGTAGVSLNVCRLRYCIEGCTPIGNYCS